MLESRALLSVFTVTDTTDNAADTGSLRYAVNNANLNPGSTIVFANNVTGAITLTNGVLPVTTNMQIQGSGANNLAISGNNASRVFNVTGGLPGTPVTIVGLTLTRGSAADGAGITNSGVLTLAYCTVTNNQASSSGGGIWNTGTMTVINCTVGTNNSAGTTGGGIENDGTMTATGSTIAHDSALNGGGIYNTKMLSASNCTIAGNSAVSQVGSSSGQGGGIANVGGQLTLTNCTIASNSAPTAGGGIFNNGGASAVLANSIVALNTAAPASPSTASDIAGSVAAASTYNLIGTGGGGGLVNGTNGNQVGVASPGLGTLAFNGGSTPTIALLPGSPAIDAGSDVVASNSALNTDQRGFSRIVNSTADIGAFEVQVYTAYSNGDSGGGSLRSALNNANLAGGSVVIITATGTIGLASALPSVSQNVQIFGPGANNLTVSGGGKSQVFVIGASVTVAIAGLTISGGLAADNDGGGILNFGTLTLTNCAVTNNSAVAALSADNGNGGGIYNTNNATLTAINCTVAFNNAVGVALNGASGNGGGIANTGTVSLVNCTIANNTAVGAFAILGGNGGGIANSGALTLTNCTVAGNEAIGTTSAIAGFGGGIGVAPSGGATLTLANTIVATNVATNGPDVSGAAASNSTNNLVGNGSGLSGISNGTNGNQVGSSTAPINPVLASPGNYGGPTLTMALLPGSPAIAAGSVASIPAGITFDQRGLPRTFNANVDIGAFQSRGFAIAISSGNNQAVVMNFHALTPFPSPLVVMVSSPFSDPVRGGVVTFTAPSSGALALFPNNKTVMALTIDASGLASVNLNANKGAGSATPYAVTASANGVSPTSVSFSLTNAPRVAQFRIKVGNSSTFGTGVPYNITVQALDASGNQVSGYRGSIQFITSQVATSPGFYSFVASDGGAHTFINGIVFAKTGVVYVTVYDTLTSVSGQAQVNVSSGLPAAMTKAKSRRLARKAPAASAKHLAQATVGLQSGKVAKAHPSVVSAAAGSLHPSGVIARRPSAAARVYAARAHILAEVKGSLRANLVAERLTGGRIK
jgi:hypothetical protein